MSVGLYELIKKKEITSGEIDLFISKNSKLLDSQTLERLDRWKKEIEFWEESAEIYKYAAMGLPHRRLVRAMEELVDPHSGEVWLDLGCGPAPMSKVIWEKSGRTLKKIVGLDLVLEPARKMEKEIPVLELKYGNMGEHLDFPDKTFDGVISNIAIPYTIEYEGIPGKEGIKRLFKEIARILKPGGQLVWSTPKRNMHLYVCVFTSIQDMIRHPGLILIANKFLKYVGTLKKKGKEGLYTYLSIEEWSELLNETGFVVDSWRRVFSHQALVNKSFLS